MHNISYSDIIDHWATPIYIFDEKGFIENYHSLQQCMRKVYPKYEISYSYKTNYTPYICNLVKKLGGYAEVVSDMEYELAKKLGYENKYIVYNGPDKGRLLDEHIISDGIVNIDNTEEARRIASIARNNPSFRFKVGIRLNLDIDPAFISRFGMRPGSEDIEQCVGTLRTERNVSIAGLHCHISRHRGIDAWRKRAEIMLQAADKYIAGPPEYISLGSGMFADMPRELKIQFGNNIPSYEDYAAAVMEPFARHYSHLNYKNLPILFTEPGTTLVARYVSFLTTVQSIKCIGNKYFATLNGSFENLGEICQMKRLPIQAIKSHNGPYYESIDLVGYTCLEQDIMYSGYQGNLSVGDILAFENVGGYSLVSKPQFILPNCAMVAFSGNGSIKEIMRAETFEDVFSKFSFED